MSEEQRIEEPEMAWTLDSKTFKPKQYRKSWWYYDKGGKLRHKNQYDPKNGSYATEKEAVAATYLRLRVAMMREDDRIARAETEIAFHEKRLEEAREERRRLDRICRKRVTDAMIGPRCEP